MAKIIKYWNRNSDPLLPTKCRLFLSSAKKFDYLAHEASRKGVSYGYEFRCLNYRPLFEGRNTLRENSHIISHVKFHVELKHFKRENDYFTYEI